MNKLILKYPLLKYPILLLLIGTFISIELFTYNFRQKGITREKNKGKSVQTTEMKSAGASLKKSGSVLFILAILYSILTCSILSVLYSNKFYTMLASWIHFSIMTFCLLFFGIGIISQIYGFFAAARAMLSLLLSPWLLTFFVAGFPLFKNINTTE